MKHTLILLLLLTITCSVYSQDLIVTNDGDYINCKITRVKDSYVYFTFKHRNEIRNTMLHISDIEEYQYNYYQVSDNYVDDYNDDYVDDYEDDNYFPRFRLAINGGYSYMTAKVAESVPDDFKNYVKKLKSGYHFGGDLSYYFSELYGVGGKCFIFKSSSSSDIYLEDTNGDRKYGIMSDDLTITYIGPVFSTRFLNWNKKNAFLMNVSLGYMGYSSDKVIIDKYKMKGSTLGMAFDIGYDIGISQNFSLGFQLSLLSGSLSKYSLNNGIITETVNLNKDEYENISRIDFTIGLRFNK